MGCQPIPSDFKGPLPPDSVGLVLGRSSSTLKGLIVHPGVIDSDFLGTVQILVTASRGVLSICPGDRIAQLLLLPSLHGLFPATSRRRGTAGLGSTGPAGAFFSFSLNERPMLALTIEGKSFSGLLDTGADASIMSSKWWPSSWPLVQSSQSLQGLGYAATPTVSAAHLRWQDSEGNQGTFRPYVMALPVNLWGRDILNQMALRLTNEYSLSSQNIMKAMGYVPGRGLGPRLQGRSEPLQPQPRPARQGLGFS